MVDRDARAGAHPRQGDPAGRQSGADTVPGLLAAAVQEHGASPCLQMVGAAALSYAEVYERAGVAAARLAGVGVEPGQRVLIMLRNSPEAVFVWLGVNLAGAVEVSLNTGYLGKPLEHAINLTQAELIVTSSEFMPLIEAALPRLEFLKKVVLMDAEAGRAGHTPPGLLVHRYGSLADAALPACAARAGDCASVIFTSGTSGPAKGVQMPHGQVTRLARNTALRTGIGAHDVFFCFYPLYHMAGKFMSVLATMSVGGKVILDNGFAPDTWLNRIREYGATLTAAHGPMLEMVYALEPSPEDRNHKLRTVRTAPFPKRIAAQFEERFGVKGMEVWGMTEIGIPCWSPLDEPLRLGSCGRIDQDQYELSVVDPETDMPLGCGDVGELVVRPRLPWTVMLGYLGMPEKTVEAWRNLWFHTGDSGYVDADGHVYFVDRVKERIRRKAENISAGDIEAAALEHPAVRQAGAVGVPSGLQGDDEIALFIVPEPAAGITPEDLLGFLVHRLPHYMIPRYIALVDDLPRTATGKLQRVMLKEARFREQLWDRKQHGISIRQLREAGSGAETGQGA
ncbi:ATP-dependent acyl-CoA ligase [Verticiella sediminum]|uniref:ATP-dependent acyl-CoA ligase n=1 Tax=Verticiella sediminum TaxID=1247510 RepID=A0A556AVD2_9BURK|nr:AMP-binding protein [Verticiella sediminum]TSH96919.1 ATP-dependent acyl-CoA ligase [Verticiella sediminum]